MQKRVKTKSRVAKRRDAGFRPTRLQISTAGGLLNLIREGNMPVGEPLREETLAGRLGVSRTSIRGALRVLEARKIVQARPHHGYRLLQAGSDMQQSEDLPISLDEKLYMQIARDRIAGVLRESVIETDLMRRYDAGRHVVLAALALLSEEGIVYRGNGREWRFRDILKSRRARDESYEIRLMLEPAALLLPTFKIIKPDLLRMRDLQGKLMVSAGRGVSSRDVFQTDASFHELLGGFSGNSFVLSVIRQQNRLRRLLEYQSYPNANRVKAWCLEHISVIDALLEENQTLAARHLTKHLENARLVPAAKKSNATHKTQGFSREFVFPTP